MADLSFYFGTMGAGKSVDLLREAYIQSKNLRNPLLVKSAVDTRDGKDVIYTRLGNLSQPCVDFNYLKKAYEDKSIYNHKIIFVDEIQFATREEVKLLKDISVFCNIEVRTYGLRTDFQGKLFEGSEAMFECADHIIEIQSTCWCGKKAIYNARFNKTGIIRSGNQIELGADDCYCPVCSFHYLTGDLGPFVNFD